MKTHKESAAVICKNVIRAEKDGLETLMNFIDDQEVTENIQKASELLMTIKGRVIVSGMGKSGHIGRKIAATFSSTGQPAMFVHPGEASHGDLGMVTHDDLLFLLSNSGETKELHDLMYYGVRNNIPIIALSGNPESTLNHLATVSLYLPNVNEACPMGLAPTTSTTLMMALGDALAITLLTWRGFTNKDFKQFHPGGNLGQQLQKVSQIMHKKNLPLVTQNTLMSETLLKMTQGGFGCVGVINEDGTLCGMVTDGDLRRHIHDDIVKKQTKDVMTKNPKTVDEDLLLAEALSYMEKYAITAIFITKNEKPTGLVHIHDFLRRGIA